MRQVHSFAAGAWIAPGAGARPIASAITGNVIAEAGNDTLDVQAMRGFARDVGGPALRAMTFHDRARMLKALALHLKAHRQTLYDLSFDTGATQADHLIDVDGGIGTMLVYAAKGGVRCPMRKSIWTGRPNNLGVRASSWVGISARHCKASPCISMRLISPSGVCWKNSRQPFWPACPQSSNPQRPRLM